MTSRDPHDRAWKNEPVHGLVHPRSNENSFASKLLVSVHTMSVFFFAPCLLHSCEQSSVFLLDVRVAFLASEAPNMVASNQKDNGRVPRSP